MRCVAEVVNRSLKADYTDYTQDNFSQSKGCCKWETLVDTENSLCTQGNLWIGTTLFCFVKIMWSKQSFLCVDTGLPM